MIVWGYKSGGSACVFDLSGGEQLPSGWAPDHMIIEDETKRTAEAITAAAGSSVLAPVIPSKFGWPFDKSSGLSPGDNPEPLSKGSPGQYPAANHMPMQQGVSAINQAYAEPKKRKGCPPGGWPKKPLLSVVEK